jgi:hypothetical protein
MPPGPDKKACVMRNHPAAFETKFEHAWQARLAERSMVKFKDERAYADAILQKN